MEAVSLDPGKLLTLYMRVARRGSMRFIFKDQDGSPHAINGIDFQFLAKRWLDSGTPEIELTVGSGLTIGGDGENELLVEVDENKTNLSPATYYWQLNNLTTIKTWLNGDLVLHNGKHDSVQTNSASITINPDGIVVVEITIGDSSSVSGAWIDCGTVDLSSNDFPEDGGTGPSGAIRKNNTFDVAVGGPSPGGGDPIPDGATIRALVDDPGQDPANWRTYY